ncbi:MAG: NAD-glutamate dehydrogenase domain-containing protein, partial [Pseudomonadota bacterium]
SPPPIPVEEIAEAIQFLEWLLDNNFTLLGMREYAFSAADKGKAAKNTSNDAMNQVGGSGLGILRDPEVSVLRRAGQMVQITPEISQFLQQPAPLIITKANMKSTVHRRAYMDYVGVKIFNDDGTLHAELRVVGLFTSTAYTRSAQTIPFLRRKLDQVIRRAGFDAESHSGKALVNVLENYPRDELFQIDVETLSRFSTSIMLLDERPRVRVLARPDRFDRFVSILVFVPRERYNTNARLAIGEYLRTVYEGRLSAFYPAYPEGPLARVHFIIGRDASETPRPSQEELEETVARLIRTWDDGLKDALVSGGDANAGSALYARYSGAFDGTYRAAFTGDDALRDITVMESLSEARPLAIGYEQRPDDPLVVDLRMYHVGKPITLSDRMPIIENMGFRAINERTYRIKRQGEAGMERLWVHVIALSHADGEAVDLKALGSRLEAAFMAVWRGQAEDDGYNALVLRAGIPWRDVALLRAYSRYLRQAGMPYSQDYMWSTLNTHHSVAAHLVDYFHARFNPHSNYSPEMQETRENAILADLEAALADVSSLDEDRIIRRFLNAITASLRTNYFQIDDDGQLKPTITFKFDPHAVEGLPAPRPFREIFVYSPRVEGVHLRFGPVARGGLRWSDRPQDFRTEVLGLVKAQQVKNAVIVPVGSKGGFVPKHLPVGGSREDVFEEGRESYKVFINSLLDITDNLDGDTVIPPADVKRLEGDDPYLVVA